MAPKPLNFCFAIIRWAPVVFITAVVVWSYYAYVIQMCLFTVQSIPEKVLYLIFYHPLLLIFLWTYVRTIFAKTGEAPKEVMLYLVGYHPLMFMFAWAYWQTIFTETGSAPKEFYLSRTDTERFDQEENEEAQREILARAARNLPVQNRTASGAIRYCEKCKCIKPDRAHHCSVCGKCVLKMDHHCPWVNNCVCFTNYKFFVLFLGYAFLYCIYVAATSLQYFIKFWTGLPDTGLGNLHILFLFFAGIMFAISVIALWGYHMWLVTKNRSTLEAFRPPIFRSGPDKDGFSLGRFSNFIEIFGEDRKYWFLPVFSSGGDGVTYPTRVAQPAATYASMENTSPSGGPPGPTQPTAAAAAAGGVAFINTGFGDGVTYPIRTVDEDYDSLLGQRQRWAEEGEADNGPGYDNRTMTNERM